jgi:hypothetical protein
VIGEVVALAPVIAPSLSRDRGAAAATAFGGLHARSR